MRPILEFIAQGRSADERDEFKLYGVIRKGHSTEQDSKSFLAQEVVKLLASHLQLFLRTYNFINSEFRKVRPAQKLAYSGKICTPKEFYEFWLKFLENFRSKLLTVQKHSIQWKRIFHSAYYLPYITIAHSKSHVVYLHILSQYPVQKAAVARRDFVGDVQLASTKRKKSFSSVIL